MGMASKLGIFLTDLMLHTRGFRPTGSFSKAQEKGRMYLPVSGVGIKPLSIDKKNRRIKFEIKLPPDLQAKVESGEAVFILPKGGVPMFGGKDMAETIKKDKGKERRQFLHKNPTRVWRSNDK